MPVSFEKVKSFRLSGDDERNLREIQDAIGLNEAETMRFAIEIAKHLMTFAVENDPASVFVEQQYKRGRTTFIDKMSHEELADALLCVKEKIGQPKFDNMLAQGKNIQERHKRDGEWFAKAKNQLVANKEPPYTFDEICRAIAQVSGCNLSYAKRLWEEHWKLGDMVQESLGKYGFLSQTATVEGVVK